MIELTRRSLTLFVAGLGLVATLLVLYGGAAVSVGRAGSPGAEVTLTVTSQGPTVSQGHVVTYEIRAHTDSTSNLSHFVIAAPSAGSTSPFPLAYVKSSLPNVCTKPANQPSPPTAQDGVKCSFGAFSSGAPDIVVSLAFSVPSTLADQDINFVATGSYSGGSNNDNSGRTNVVAGSAATHVGTDDDTESGFVVSALGDTLATVTAPNGDQPGNPQSASASVKKDSAPGFGVSGTVHEINHAIDDTTTDCGPGASCWGQTEVVTFVNSAGEDVALLTPGTVVIRTDSTEIPNGVTKNNIQWFHTVDGGEPELLPACVTGDPVPTSGCVQPVSKLKDNDLLTTILAFHHGQYRP
jgi:hypothetical protein